MGQILFGGMFSFLVTLLILPLLIRVGKSRRLFVPISFRRVHKGNVTALGGFAIFLATFLSVIIFSDFIDFVQNRYLLLAGILMFIIGFRDDLREVNPWAKLVGQIMVASVVVYLAGYRIYEFAFFQNNIQIHSPWAEIITIVFILVIVNSYNFIDGVDLQAALIAIVVLASYGLWFFVNKQYDTGLLLCSLGVSLLAFAIFNYSPAKIFMGDMGTLIIGLLIAITFIKFNQLHDSDVDLRFAVKNPYIFMFTSFLFPISDMIRVSVTRMLRGSSPMKGDRNHIHHWLLKLGWKQNHIAFFTSGITLALIVVNFLLQDMDFDSYLLLILNITFILVIYFLLFQSIRKKALT